jgi:hypothetical protein
MPIHTCVQIAYICLHTCMQMDVIVYAMYVHTYMYTDGVHIHACMDTYMYAHGCHCAWNTCPHKHRTCMPMDAILYAKYAHTYIHAHIHTYMYADGYHCVCIIYPGTHTCRVMVLCMRYMHVQWVCSIYPYVHVCMTICMHASLYVDGIHPSYKSHDTVLYGFECLLDQPIHPCTHALHACICRFARAMYAGKKHKSSTHLASMHACIKYVHRCIMYAFIGRFDTTSMSLLQLMHSRLELDQFRVWAPHVVVFLYLVQAGHFVSTSLISFCITDY